MKLQTNHIKLGRKGDKIGLYIEIPSNTDTDKLQKIINHEKAKTVDIEVKREKRSLSMNSYFWTLTHKLAKLMNSTDQDIYENLLDSFGTAEYIVVKPDIVQHLKKAYKLIDVIGSVQVNGKPGVQVKCIRGSSSYSKKEMSRLIDGTIEECKVLGIEVLSPDEIKRLIDSMEG